MVWNKGLKTGLVPKTAYKKGNKHHPNWHKALEEGRIKAPGGWNKNLPPEQQPGYKGGRQKTGSGYIQILIPQHPFADKRGRILEHRYAMEQFLGRYLKKEERIDHINGDKSDNRIENLRLATHSQNLCNRGKPINNTTGYKNIHLDKRSNKYSIQIGFETKIYSLGSYRTLGEAIIIRDKALKKIHGEFAKLD